MKLNRAFRTGSSKAKNEDELNEIVEQLRTTRDSLAVGQPNAGNFQNLREFQREILKALDSSDPKLHKLAKEMFS